MNICLLEFVEGRGGFKEVDQEGHDKFRGRNRTDNSEPDEGEKEKDRLG